MSNYIPPTIKCFWCNDKMTIGGPTRIGSGLNDVSYFCCNCGGIAYFARYDDRNIKTFTVNYDTSEKVDKNTSNERTIGHWLDGSDDLLPIGGFHDWLFWCSAPETICPHWIGLDFETLEKYLIKVCKDE